MAISASNSTAPMPEPYHAFPESKFETLSTVTIPLAAIGLVVCGLLHFRSEPAMQVDLRQLSCRWWIWWIRVIVLCYFIPSVFVTSLFSQADTTGNYDDGEMAGQMSAAIVIAAAIEAAVNAYFFIKNSTHRIYPRLGRRVLFVAMSVLLGVAIFTNHYNSIDYYGPVRVSGVGLKWVRPEQQVDSHNPSYYYYYRLEQTIEWGDSWACPKTPKKWCSVGMDDLYKEECQYEIFCKGRPEYNGQCASEEEKAEAFSYLVGCFIKQAAKEGLQPGDFFTSTNFTRSVAPWDDPLRPHTVTRAVTCGPRCTAEETAPPEALAHQVNMEWPVAIALVLVGSALLAVGVWKGQEQKPRVPVIHARFVQFSTIEGANDLALSQIGIQKPSASAVPIARAVPMIEAANDLALSQNGIQKPSAGAVPIARAVPMV